MVAFAHMAKPHKPNAIGALARNLRLERDWPLREAAEKLGWSLTLLSKKERGEISINPRERAELAKVYGLSIEDFDARWRGGVPMGHERRPAPVGIPVVNRAPAGHVVAYDHDDFAEGEYHNAAHYIERGDLDDPLAFAVVVTGDSMNPILHDGDYAIFTPMHVPRPRATLKPGDIVFVRLGPESEQEGCVIGYWFPEGKRVSITKENAKYPPIVCEQDEIVRVARLIEHRRRWA